jgi:hypothetical protein
MDGTFGKAIIRPLSLIGLAIIVFVISGCANLGGDKAPTKTREEAVQRYNYRGDKNELFAEAPSITPVVAANGGSVTQIYRFAVLAPDVNKRFQVQEVVTLSGGDIVIELSRKVFEKTQAIHTTTMQFVIPKDLPRGNYNLITIIGIDGSAKKLTAQFSVR